MSDGGGERPAVEPTDERGTSGSPIASVEVVYPLGEVYEASNEILDMLEESGMEVSLGVFALVLTLGRTLSPVEMTPQQEQLFVQSALEFMQAALVQGEPN